MVDTQVKICGIKTKEALGAALLGGARFIGFVFFPLSPRYIEVEKAQELAFALPDGVQSVGLFVDPTDLHLDMVLKHVQLDMIQLHGNETPARVSEIKARYGVSVIKAFRIGSARDVALAHSYVDAADWYLFDTKSASSSEVPGGTGEVFDWALLALEEFDKPWMLSGGLSVENVGDALSVLSPMAVDVSSGVERVRGEKDPCLIKAFLEIVKRI